MGEGFIDLGYEPAKDDLCVLFYVEPAQGVSFEKAINHMTGESSIGTWTDVVTMRKEIQERLKPSAYSIDEENGLVEIAYPLELFEPTNVPQIMSSVAGNIYGMKAVENLRLLDIRLPETMVKLFLGPEFGILGVREILGVKDRPLAGTIVKPKVGLSAREHAKVAYDAWVGGCDIVKDDENLTDQLFNRFKERVEETLKARDRAEAETGEGKVYMPNITAETRTMVERLGYVKDEGGRYAMLDVVTIGFSALQTVRDKYFGLVLHAHRAMHAALTRNKRHGITMLALAKLYRLIGADQLHIGTVVGKMEGPAEEVISIREEITQNQVGRSKMRLEQEWFGHKPVFPVCSGGLHPGLVPELVDIMGKDIIIQAGGGVHGNPDGTTAGAKAMRQAVDAAMEGITLEEYAKDHSELKKALEKWQ